MTDREKLVELLKQPFQNGKGISLEDMAVHLLLHGVMVQQWISVEDRLPEDDGTYCLLFSDGTILGAKRCGGCFPPWADAMGYAHWIPLPELPKEEEA